MSASSPRHASPPPRHASSSHRHRLAVPRHRPPSGLLWGRGAVCVVSSGWVVFATAREIQAQAMRIRTRRAWGMEAHTAPRPHRDRTATAPRPHHGLAVCLPWLRETLEGASCGVGLSLSQHPSSQQKGGTALVWTSHRTFGAFFSRAVAPCAFGGFPGPRSFFPPPLFLPALFLPLSLLPTRPALTPAGELASQPKGRRPPECAHPPDRAHVSVGWE